MTRIEKVFAVAMLLVLMAGWLGRWNQFSDSVNHLLPFWLLPAFAAAVLIMVRGQQKPYRRNFAIGAVAFCLCVDLCVERVLPDVFMRITGSNVSRANMTNQAGIKIISLNMRKNNPRAKDIAQWLSRQNADIIILLEVIGSNENILEPMKRYYPYQLDCHGAIRTCSTVIVSRQRPDRFQRLSFGDPENRKALSAMTVGFRFDGQPLAITAVHLSRPFPFGTQQSELATLAHAMKKAKKEDQLVMGDFNMTPWAFEMRAVENSLALPRVSAAIFSWPADLALMPPALPIDQMFLGSGWKLQLLEAGPNIGSDHRPLIAEITKAI